MVGGLNDLRHMAREVIDGDLYLTLGTTEPDQRPRLSPLCCTGVDTRREVSL
ncbi:hypothetical protein ACQP1W_25750 [Spirillospora sp. CA-255316]